MTETKHYKLYNTDAFEILESLEDNSVDLVLNDPPYGTTSIEWDKILDFNQMWKEVKRVLKPNKNVLLFGSQPFSSKVILSNEEWFKYELIWNKNKCGSPGLAKYRPQKVHENILVFADGTGVYNPIMEEGEPYTRYNPDGYGSGKNDHGYGFGKNNTGHTNSGTRYPKSIIHASRNFSAQQTTHPTQKPTNLLSWLIMTYSDRGDVVLDFTMGTGSCGVASLMTGRKFIGVERKEKYYNVAAKRMELCGYNVIKPEDSQLTTQLSKDMITVPTNSHEGLFYKLLSNVDLKEIESGIDIGIEKWLKDT